MADRAFGSSFHLLADLASDLTLTVTVADPWGTSAGSADATEIAAGSGRYSVDVPVANTVPNTPGHWTAVWADDSDVTQLTQVFTVGDDLGSTLFDTRLRAAGQLFPVVIGRIAYMSNGAFADSTLIGGADEYLGQWMLPDVTNDQAGLYRLVSEYNETTFTLSEQFPVDLDANERYILLDPRLHPDTLNRALLGTAQDLALRTYVQVQAQGLTPDANGIVALPAGWSHVSGVAQITIQSGTMTVVAPGSWQCLPGRKLQVSGADATVTLDIEGVRYGRPPLWDDSVLDIPAEVLIPKVAHDLHLNFSGGPATDYDAHLQRAQAAFQEYGVQLSIALPRLPQNAARIRP